MQMDLKKLQDTNSALSLSESSCGEYKESCHDRILWNEISQLHQATLQISNSCFGYKKMCTSLIVAGCAFIAKFIPETNSYSWLAIFTSLTAAGFWICDATAYFYQKKTREVIQRKLSKIASNNKIDTLYDQYSQAPRWISAFFNSSMTLYLYLAIGSAALWGYEFFLGVIK